MKNFWANYVVVEIKDLPREQLINAALQAEIALSRVHREKDSLVVSVHSQDCRRLLNIVRQNRGKAKIRAKKGVIFWWLGLMRRQGVLLGLAVCCSLVYLCLSYIWSYDISGNERYSEEEIIAIIGEYGVHTGVCKNDLDFPEITKEILKDYNGELAWFWMQPKGTVLEIRLKEKDNAFLDYDRTADLVAAKDGIISDILVLEGTARVKVGETVYRGEILIQGVEYDNWAKNEEGVYEPDGTGRGIRAQGTVKALVQYETNGVCSLKEHYLQDTGTKEKHYRLLKNEQEILVWGRSEGIGLEKVVWQKELQAGADLWQLQALESQPQTLNERSYDLNAAYQCSMERSEAALAAYQLPAESILECQSFLFPTADERLVMVKTIATVKEDLVQVVYR